MTKGTCSGCEKSMAKAAMTRHLASCGRSEHGPPAFVISVSDRHAPSDYWLHLEVPSHAPLRELDGCLRDLWLECCGHLSMFEIDGRTYAIDADLLGGGPSAFEDFDDASMDVGIGAVLEPGGEASHVYDMAPPPSCACAASSGVWVTATARSGCWRATGRRPTRARHAASRQRRSARNAASRRRRCAMAARLDIPVIASSSCRWSTRRASASAAIPGSSQTSSPRAAARSARS